MMGSNNHTNELIKWTVILGDFVLLNVVLFVFCKQDTRIASWSWGRDLRMFLLISNFALFLSEWKFHTFIHQRLVSAGDVLRNIVMLTLAQTVIAYILMRHLLYWTAVGRVLLEIGTALFVVFVIIRMIERNVIKRMRRLGRNTRAMVLVGSDPELKSVYRQLLCDPTTGYRVVGYYTMKDEGEKMDDLKWLGTVDNLLDCDKRVKVDWPVDEMYVCLSRREREIIQKLSQFCDRHLTRFYYVPLSVETIQQNLKREYINDIEVYTTHESPLDNVGNRISKRVLDIIISLVALALVGVLYPIIYIVIKLQSPGPIFFKQLRTGMDGREFVCYKFRSMHVNKDADKLQATKNDPRIFPFGNFMRETNIDEFPQFWNVLKGDMSVVGPRPHMLEHTKKYSKVIGEYMVRHFVKPGITGYAQVTGYRGETKELWQMEERVRRDIWYIEQWSIWLDIRIIWLTFKTFFVHDKNAY